MSDVKISLSRVHLGYLFAIFTLFLWTDKEPRRFPKTRRCYHLSSKIENV